MSNAYEDYLVVDSDLKYKDDRFYNVIKYLILNPK